MQILCALFTAAGSGSLGPALPSELATIVVESGRHERIDTPVFVPLSAKEMGRVDVPADRLAQSALELIEIGGGNTARAIPAQWQAPSNSSFSAFKDGALAFILPGKTPANSMREFKLCQAEGSVPTGPLAIEDDKGKALLLKHGSHPVARYNYGLVRKQPGRPDIFDRTAYFHPVWAPSGQVITDDFPKSHPHQRGVFFTWTRATIGDYQADFWNLGANKGKTIHNRLDQSIAGPVFAGFVAHNELIAQARCVIRETWVTRLYAQPAGPWVIDMDIRHTATDRPVTLDKYLYGGMAFRGRPDWFGNKRPTVMASDGYDAKEGAAEKARWVDMAGVLPLGGHGGLTMLDHPLNPPYPTAIRIHPQVPYFCFAYSHRQPYEIPAGESLELRYRCVVHDGLPDKAADERWAADFADPPKITVTPATGQK